MEKQREKVSSASVFLPKLFMAVLFSALFALPVWRLSAVYLPMDMVWSQRLVYACSSEGVDQRQVRDFLELNYIRFRSLAQRDYSQVAGSLSVKYDLPNMAMELLAWCPEDSQIISSESFEEEFRGFARHCIGIELVGPREMLESDTAQSRLKKWLDENKDKLKDMRETKVDLQMEINDSQQQMLAIESMQIGGLVAPRTDEAEKDQPVQDLGEIEKSLTRLQARQKELDMKAAVCNDATELSEIDREKDEVFQERIRLLASQRTAKSQVKPLGERTIASEQARAKDRYEFARYKLNILEGNIADLESEIAFVSRFIPDSEGRSPAFDKLLPESPDGFDVYAGTTDFYLRGTKSEIVKTRSLSMLQRMAIGLSGFFGFVLGGLIFNLVGRVRPEAKVLVDDTAWRCSDAGLSMHLSAYDDDRELTQVQEQGDVGDMPGGEDDIARDFFRFADDEMSGEPDFEEQEPDGIEDLSNLNGFASWWVESYDKLAYKLCDSRSALSDGIIFSALDKSLFSARFMVNLSISLALKGEKVLLVSASQDGILEKIFSDFSDGQIEEIPGTATDGCGFGSGVFSMPGFWDCLMNDLPLTRHLTPSPLEGLKFLHSGKLGSSKSVNNEINCNSDYVDSEDDTEYDCILIYMPELFGDGISAFCERSKTVPISNLLARFSNIAVVDSAFNKISERKLLSVRDMLSKSGCRLIEM